MDTHVQRRSKALSVPPTFIVGCAEDRRINGDKRTKGTIEHKQYVNHLFDLVTYTELF